MKFYVLLKRNLSLFYKDKMLFFVSLITPLILILLYATFLINVYRSTFLEALPSQVVIDKTLVEGLIGGQMMSSLLAVIPITTAFTSSTLIVRDKTNKAIDDISMTPTSKVTIILSYFSTTFINTLLTCFVAMIGCFVYIAIVGWYIKFTTILLLLLGIIVMTLFGSLFSSIINYFLSTEQQVAAISTIVSSCYGFICGAYMPLSQFPIGLQKFIKFLPGTYGTSYLRYVSTIDTINALQEATGMGDDIVQNILLSIDGRIEFGETFIPYYWCLLIVFLITALLLIIYCTIVYLGKNNHKKIIFTKKS